MSRFLEEGPVEQWKNACQSASALVQSSFKCKPPQPLNGFLRQGRCRSLLAWNLIEGIGRKDELMHYRIWRKIYQGRPPNSICFWLDFVSSSWRVIHKTRNWSLVELHLLNWGSMVGQWMQEFNLRRNFSSFSWRPSFVFKYWLANYVSRLSNCSMVDLSNRNF